MCANPQKPVTQRKHSKSMSGFSKRSFLTARFRLLEYHTIPMLEMVSASNPLMASLQNPNPHYQTCQQQQWLGCSIVSEIHMLCELFMNPPRCMNGRKRGQLNITMLTGTEIPSSQVQHGMINQGLISKLTEHGYTGGVRVSHCRHNALSIIATMRQTSHDTASKQDIPCS